MDSLPVFLVIRDRPVILIGSGAAAEAKRRLLERAGARVVDETAPDARLAIVAGDDPDDIIAARLKARGILVNVVDKPALCDFTMPAIVDRAPVTVAIGTAGASASLAKALRQRIEALLPADLGTLALALRAARAAIAGRFPDPTDRRVALDRALAPGGPLDPVRAGLDPDSVAGWLAAATPGQTGRHDHIRLRSDDPDDLTLREARLLAEADTIRHAPGVPAAILARGRADAARRPLDGAPPPPGRTVDVAGPAA